ncbi:MAG: NAD(P)/FAD-dependent oxidoreductase [Desulfovibrionaceae bacterium]
MATTDTPHALILGAGASGLVAALEAARRGRAVTVIDSGAKPARKVRIAGGGKCNFTNRDVGADNYVCANPHFPKSALARFGPQDMLDRVAAWGIAVEERDHGRLFCQDAAGALAGALIHDCRRAGVAFATGCTVRQAMKDGEDFVVHTDQGTFRAPALLVALGGPAWPQAGATDTGHALAKGFGLPIIAPRPALAPLLFPTQRCAAPKQSGGSSKNTAARKGSGPAAHTARPGAASSPGAPAASPAATWAMGGLSGISLTVAASCAGRTFTDELLFTHTGLSGPAALQLSLYWCAGEGIVLDLLPGQDIAARLAPLRQGKSGNTLVKNLLPRLLPARLAEAVCPPALADTPIAQIPARDMAALADALHRLTLTPSRTEGFRKAEVTAGGVDTAALSSRTMEASAVQGLFFSGEVLDVTGQLGGYNLHWAWASGWAAGQAL